MRTWMFFKSKNQYSLTTYKSESKTKPIQISVEMWEILTAFTVILSVASSIIWASATTPKQQEREFLFIDRSKSQVYNLYQKTADLPITHTNLVHEDDNLDQINSKIASASVNKDQLENYIQKIEQNEVATQEIIASFKSQNSSLRSESDFLSFAESFEQYTTEKKLFYENLLIFNEKSLSIRKDLFKLASGDFETEFQINIEEEIVSLDYLSLVGKDWIVSVENWQEDWQELKNSAEEIDKEKIVSLKSQYETIQKVTFDDRQFQKKIDESKDKIEQNLEKIEKWQKEYIQNNNYIFRDEKDENIVLISKT